MHSYMSPHGDMTLVRIGYTVAKEVGRSMIKFIVLSTQRSGSSYLCSLLDKHPAIRCVEEIFMPRNRNEITYRSWRSASFSRRLKDWLNRQQSVDAYLRQLCEKHRRFDAFGFKLMYGQAQRYPEVIDWCRNNDVKVVHLIRRNSLKMVVSRKVAAKRGVYLSTRPVEAVTVNLDTRRLVRELRESERLVQRNRELFSALPYLETSYEEIMADRDQQLRRVLTFLGCEVNVQLSSELVKTSPDSLESLIDNYGEVRATLAGSRFEGYLEQDLRV